MRDQHFGVVSRILERHKFKKQSVLDSAEEVVQVLNNSQGYLREEKLAEYEARARENYMRKLTGKKRLAFKYTIPIYSAAIHYNLPSQVIYPYKRKIQQMTNYYNLQNVMENGEFKLKSTIYSDLTDLFDIDSKVTRSKKPHNVTEAVVTRIERDTPLQFEQNKTLIDNNLTQKWILIEDLLNKRSIQIYIFVSFYILRNKKGLILS
jgi:hypothetical protein